MGWVILAATIVAVAALYVGVWIGLHAGASHLGLVEFQAACAQADNRALRRDVHNLYLTVADYAEELHAAEAENRRMEAENRCLTVLNNRHNVTRAWLMDQLYDHQTTEEFFRIIGQEKP